MFKMTWINALGLLFICVLMVAVFVSPYLFSVMDEYGVALPNYVVYCIGPLKQLKKYWYIFLVPAIGLFVIPTRYVEPLRIQVIEPYLLTVVIALTLLLIGVISIPLHEIIANYLATH